MLRTSSRIHTFVYAVLLSIILICSTVHLSSWVASTLDPNDPANLIYMSVIVSGVLAPPASFMLAVYSNRLIRVQEQLHALATTDPLTGLLNRRAFEAFYDREAARALRTGKVNSIMLLDLDHFKRVNSIFGHDGGDVALRNIAECIRKTVRFGTDEAARWGGEEFAVILAGTDRDNAIKAALRLRDKLNALDIVYAGKSIPVTASFGVIQCTSGESLEEAVRRADKCLTRAKKDGRDKVVAFRPIVLNKSLFRLALIFG